MESPNASPRRARGIDLTEAQLISVRDVFERVLPNAEVWVFGSRATGCARPYSDLDLLLTWPAALDWLALADLRDAFEASDLPFRVDLVESAALSGVLKARVESERLRLL